MTGVFWRRLHRVYTRRDAECGQLSGAPPPIYIYIIYACDCIALYKRVL